MKTHPFSITVKGKTLNFIATSEEEFDFVDFHAAIRTAAEVSISPSGVTGSTDSGYSSNFGGALAALKDGHKVKRAGWNAGGQYIYHVPANSYPAVTEVAKKQFGEMVPYNAYLAIKTVQNTVAPWAPSQTDVLADDWSVVLESI